MWLILVTVFQRSKGGYYGLMSPREFRAFRAFGAFRACARELCKSKSEKRVQSRVAVRAGTSWIRSELFFAGN